MRLERFVLAIEAFSATAPDGVVRTERVLDGKSEIFGDGGGFFTLRDVSSSGNESGFFNLTQIKNVNITDGKLTYSGSMSAKPENKDNTVNGFTLAVTPIR